MSPEAKTLPTKTPADSCRNFGLRFGRRTFCWRNCRKSIWAIQSSILLAAKYPTVHKRILQCSCIFQTRFHYITKQTRVQFKQAQIYAWLNSAYFHLFQCLLKKKPVIRFFIIVTWFWAQEKPSGLKRATKVIQKLITFGVHFRLNARLFLLFAVQIDFCSEVFDWKEIYAPWLFIRVRTVRLWRKRRDSPDEPFGGLKKIQLNLFLQKLFFPHLGHLNFLFVKVCVPKIKSFIDGTNFSPQFGHS